MAVGVHLVEFCGVLVVAGGYLGAAVDIAFGRCGRVGLFGWRLTVAAREWVYRQAAEPVKVRSGDVGA